jgi:hypothetical protein
MKFRPFVLSLLCVSGLVGQGCSSLQSGKGNALPLDSARLQLLEATITRDEGAIQPILAPDFTWREDDAPLTETAFSFWDRQRLWAILHDLLKQPMATKGEMRVAPRNALSSDYAGPRLAWRKIGDEWRLAYFYAGTNPPASQR